MESGDVVAELPNAKLRELIDRFDAGDQSESLAESFFELTENHVSEAHFFLGCFFEDGSNGLKKDSKAAAYHYLQSVKLSGYVEGALAYARLSLAGAGVEQDIEGARTLLGEIVNRVEHPVALLWLGRSYHFVPSENQDHDMARRFYERSARFGNVYALLNLAILERDLGRSFRSIFLRSKATVISMCIGWRNPRDPRLRAT